MNTALTIIMILGSISFAISGALTAMQKRFDLIGIVIIAFATAVGGGTIRDLLIGRDIFWISEPTYTYVIIAGAISAIIFRKYLNYLRTTLLFFDTVGLGLFTVLGVEIGISFELDMLICVVLGVITGSFGGILRDVLVNDIPIIFKKEIYASISILGGSLYIILRLFDLNLILIKIIAISLIIILRFIVIRYKLSLPLLYKNDKSE
jgi:uncharacterized membrane protein YeiH